MSGIANSGHGIGKVMKDTYTRFTMNSRYEQIIVPVFILVLLFLLLFLKLA